ncbi:hypothetical protein [Streptomyces exfoliatus]|uniref:hypothetical protein n=1 Tax=Streptomyces exfoliatus TaxID=1905 RepID=UPI003C2C756D
MGPNPGSVHRAKSTSGRSLRHPAAVGRRDLEALRRKPTLRRLRAVDLDGSVRLTPWDVLHTLYLRDGNLVEVEIDGLGRQRHTFRQG